MTPGESHASRGMVAHDSHHAGAAARVFLPAPQRLLGKTPCSIVTCQALATRTAEKILVNEFGGAPFVSTGSPTVSTDPSITGALASVGL
jgi:hypothetical protein